jgi:Cu2+-exporting ATPase
MATRLDGDELQVVPSASLRPGDTILARPGERIPVDCRIIDGVTELDESTISGEPMPVLRRQGDSAAAGTLNLTASIKLSVERVAAESFIARMARMVEEAQNRKAPIQSLADRIASRFVPFVSLVAAGTWFFWFFSGAPQGAALLNAVAVLIVACPCALGLATPTAVLVASGSATARGILFRGGDILETTGHIDLVAFDKTGTLTLGRPTVTEVLPAPGRRVEDVLQLASQLESGSNHPLAQGIMARAKSAGVELRPAGSVVTIPGRGLRKTDAEGEVLVGSRTFLVENGVEVPKVASGVVTEVHVSLDGLWQGVLLVQDPLRDDALEAVTKLRQAGLGTILLTGDRAETAEQVCASLSMPGNYLADLSPADKADWVSTRQASGAKVMMVGDGINDAPALSLADIGCAMAGGTDIALETSDLVMTRSALGRLYEAVIIARLTLQTIRQNLFWAFSYNLVTIPLAASGQLAPVWAAAAMAGSSVLVVSNSLRLGRRVRRTFSVANRPANH